MLYYTVDVGRSVNEVLWLVQALQTVDRPQVVTPEGWVPGDDAVEPPPETVSAIDTRRERTKDGSREESYGCVDRYYYKRPASDPGP